MSRSGRILIVLGMFAVAVFLVTWTAMNYVATEPATINYITGHQAGQPVHLILQTDGAVGTGAHPTWVSYQTMTPQTHDWVHTTLVRLPAHTKIDVTIYQFDSGSPLRNQHFGRVTGTAGGSATVNGRRFRAINSYHTFTGAGFGHTFTIPALGVNVPLVGVQTTKPTFCTSGPCNPATQLHTTTKFSFTTPGVGNYHFQCFIPCGAGRYGGNGTAMQTLGYMGGFFEVQ